MPVPTTDAIRDPRCSTRRCSTAHGSTLPLDENLRVSSALPDNCTAADVVLEIECGVVGG